MLDIILVILLIFGLLRGLKRGFIMQFIYLTGFIIAFVVAKKYYIPLSTKIKLWIPYSNTGENSFLETLFNVTNLEDVFYRAIAFIIIFVSVKIIWQILGSMIDFVASLPILKQLNTWAGAVLGFIETYLLLLLLIFISILIPVDFIQNLVSDSSFAAWMLENTPYFSGKINDLWFEYQASS